MTKKLQNFEGEWVYTVTLSEVPEDHTADDLARDKVLAKRPVDKSDANVMLHVSGRKRGKGEKLPCEG